MKFKLAFGGALVVGVCWLLAPNLVWAWTYAPASSEDVVAGPHYSADGKYLVVLSDVKKKTFDQVLFFKTDNAKPTWVYSPTSKVFDVGISGNGQYVAAVGSKATLFKRQSKKPIWSTYITGSVFNTVVLTTTGNQIVAGDRQGRVQLFSSAAPTVIKSWTLSRQEDWVDNVSVSGDGKKILAATHLAAYFIRADQTRPAWRYATKKHIERARLSADGKSAVVTDRENVYFFRTSQSKPAWSKTYKSFYAPTAEIADNGSVVIVGTTTTTYAYNARGEELWHYDLPSGLKGEVALSGNGRYVAASQGSSYVYLFDNNFGAGNRPFRFYTANRPQYAALDKSGNLVTYGRYDLTSVEPPPGVIAEQLSIPVYAAGMDLRLRVFASNPGAANDHLKVKVALSLPQINWWDGAAAQSEAQKQTPATRSKALQYAAEALPGYSVIYDQPYVIGKNTSRDTTLTITVPSLLFPEWLNDALAFLGDVLPFDSMMEDWSDPLKDLLGKDAAESTITEANREFVNKSAIIPMLGIGTVQLYNDDTGVVYDTDSFYFIFGLMGA